MFREFEFAALEPWIFLTWAALAVLGISAWGIARRRRFLDLFGYDRDRSQDWLASLRRRRWRRAFALAGSLILLTAAAVQPRCNPEKTTVRVSARDIVILLDVSRSMLADDLKPNRLERAKLEIERLCDELKGDRLGLVVFAGNAEIQCPLTLDYSYLKSVLRAADYRSASQGGTRIGDAIRKALYDLLGLDPDRVKAEGGAKVGETVVAEERRPQKNVHASLLLITDGEEPDPQERSYYKEAAEAARAFKVGIYAVGLGSETGTPIPITGKDGRAEYLKTRDGEIVRTKLDSRAIEDIVNTAAAEYKPRSYYHVATQNFDLVKFFKETIDTETGQEVTEDYTFWTEIFQPFLLGGLALYLLYLLIPERPPYGQLRTLEVAP